MECVELSDNDAGRSSESCRECDAQILFKSSNSVAFRIFSFDWPVLNTTSIVLNLHVLLKNRQPLSNSAPGCSQAQAKNNSDTSTSKRTVHIIVIIIINRKYPQIIPSKDIITITLAGKLSEFRPFLVQVRSQARVTLPIALIPQLITIIPIDHHEVHRFFQYITY
jgi:hypothetical protein